MWQLRKDGYAESTVETVSRRLRHLADCVCLDEPERVKGFIADAECSSSFKGNMVNAYSHYAAYHGLVWNRPLFQRAYSIKKLPLESDIDLIISYAKTRSRVAFRLVKECGLRPVEVSRLTVKQFDLHGGVVYPETAKGGEARVLQLKSETLALLKHLITALGLSFNDRVFRGSKVLQTNWTRMRNRVAARLGKPELKQIRLYDLRHYYGSARALQTADGGYALAGSASIVKTDEGGHIQWNTTCTDVSWVNYPIVETSGSLVVAGGWYDNTTHFLLVRPDTEYGLAWTDSTANTITIYRGTTDPYWNFVRIRIWKPVTP